MKGNKLMSDKIGVYFYIDKICEEYRLIYVIKNIKTGEIFINLRKKLKNEDSEKIALESLEYLLSNILSLIKINEIKETSEIYFFTNNINALNILNKKLYLKSKALKFFAEKINLCNCKELQKIKSFIKKENKTSIGVYLKCKKVGKEYRKLLKRNSTIDLLKEKCHLAKTLVFFDFEMNCLVDFKSVEIISVGACKINLSTGMVDRFYSLVKPQEVNELTEKCIEITSLDQQEIDNAENFNKVFTSLGNWIQDMDTLYLYWGGNDISVLKNDYKRNSSLNKTALNILKNNIDFQEVLCKDILNKEDMLSLSNAILNYDLEFKGLKHNSSDDAYNLYRLFFKIKNDGIMNL